MAEISAKTVKELRDQTGAGMMDCKKALGEAGGDLEEAVELLRERGLAKAAKRGGRETDEGTVAMAFTDGGGALVELGCETDFVAKTDDFQALAKSLAQAAADAGLDSVEAVLGAEIDGGKADEVVKAAIGKLGENIVLKRVEYQSLDGAGRVGGYIHAGGKLGVIVALAGEGGGNILDTLAKDLAMHVAAADPTPVAVDRDSVPAAVVEKERDFLTKQAEQSGKPANVIEKIVEGRIGKFFSEICLLEQAFVKDPDRSVAQLLEDVSKQAGGEIRVAGFHRFKLGEAIEA